MYSYFIGIPRIQLLLRLGRENPNQGPRAFVLSLDPKFAHVNFSALYVGPKSGVAKSVPLILWPHGGPHSAVPNE